MQAERAGQCGRGGSRGRRHARASPTQLGLASATAEELWRTEQVFEVVSKLGLVGNLQKARAQLAQLEGDGQWTTEKAFELMSRAGYTGTLADARAQLANKHRLK